MEDTQQVIDREVNPRAYPASQVDARTHVQSKKCKFEQQDITFTYWTGKTKKGS